MRLSTASVSSPPAPLLTDAEWVQLIGLIPRTDPAGPWDGWYDNQGVTE
jgi:hypothetical protein